jgi:hypothetical protein
MSDCVRNRWHEGWGRKVIEEVVVLARTDAQKAVVDLLVKEATVTRRDGRPSPSGWTSSTVYTGGQGADLATIEFVKTKVLRLETPAIVDILDGNGLTLVTYEEFGDIANTA